MDNAIGRVQPGMVLEVEQVEPVDRVGPLVLALEYLFVLQVVLYSQRAVRAGAAITLPGSTPVP